MVDDDEQEREGRRVVLERVPGIEVAAAVHHSVALTSPSLWGGADVVLLDLWERGSCRYDEFAGVSVAAALRKRYPVPLHEAVRSGRWADHLTIIAISRMLGGDVIGKRLREAGVDLAFDRDDPQVCGSAGLAELVRDPAGFLHDGRARADRWSPTPGAEELGIAGQSKINELVADADSGGPAATFCADRTPHNQAERRRWTKVRDEVVERFGLATPLSRQTGGVRRNHMRFDDLRALLDRARRPELPSPGGRNSDPL